MLFGLDQDSWLIIALIFLGLSGVYYLWLWWGGFMRDKKAGKKIELPWE